MTVMLTTEEYWVAISDFGQNKQGLDGGEHMFNSSKGVQYGIGRNHNLFLDRQRRR